MDHDELLEQALAGYSAVEPPAGFRERVLRRVNRRRRAVTWLAVPIAACVVLWVTMPARVHRKILVRTAQANRTEPVARMTAARKVRVSRRRVGEVRKQVLSGQERALVDWVSRSPETAAAELMAMKEQMAWLIQVNALEIQAIQIQAIQLEERKR